MLITFFVGALVVMGLVIATLVYRNRADRKSHELATQQTINAAVTRRDQHREDLDKRLHALHEAQRYETIEDNAHLADRSDFDNDWGGLPRSGDGAGAADSGAESSVATGAAGDNGSRTD
ncbi:MAG TPA: hypothetical protein VIF37_16290 [Methylobacter sp.]